MSRLTTIWIRGEQIEGPYLIEGEERAVFQAILPEGSIKFIVNLFSQNGQELQNFLGTKRQLMLSIDRDGTLREIRTQPFVMKIGFSLELRALVNFWHEVMQSLFDYAENGLLPIPLRRAIAGFFAKLAQNPWVLGLTNEESAMLEKIANDIFTRTAPGQANNFTLESDK